MNRFWKATGIAAIVLHFSLLLIHCFPQTFANTAALTIADHYAYPLFRQRWQMFAYEPPMGNYKLYYRCIFKNGHSTDWIDPGKETLQKLKSNPFWNYEKQYAIYESIFKDLYYSNAAILEQLKKEKAAPKMEEAERERRIRNSSEYKNAVRYVERKVSENYELSLLSAIELKYVSTTLPNLQHKSAAPLIETVNFPGIRIEN